MRPCCSNRCAPKMSARIGASTGPHEGSRMSHSVRDAPGTRLSRADAAIYPTVPAVPWRPGCQRPLWMSPSVKRRSRAWTRLHSAAQEIFRGCFGRRANARPRPIVQAGTCLHCPRRSQCSRTAHCLFCFSCQTPKAQSAGRRLAVGGAFQKGKYYEKAATAPCAVEQCRRSAFERTQRCAITPRSSERIISTRRFNWRFCAVSLAATGMDSP